MKPLAELAGTWCKIKLLQAVLGGRGESRHDNGDIVVIFIISIIIIIKEKSKPSFPPPRKRHRLHQQQLRHHVRKGPHRLTDRPGARAARRAPAGTGSNEKP